MPRLSQKAVEFIIGFEVSSRANYEAKLRRPTWPEGASGITIGVGYDLGYVTRGEMERVWGPVLPAAMVAALRTVVGKKGSDAKSALAMIRPQVDVPWADAFAVFRDDTLGKFETMTTTALPNTHDISPDSLGALVSLTFNRGPSYGKSKDPNDTKDRYREMRAIKAAMTVKDYASIPATIKAMQRLWPTVAGLQRRRRDEARLFQDGLG